MKPRTKLLVLMLCLLLIAPTIGGTVTATNDEHGMSPRLAPPSAPPDYLVRLTKASLLNPLTYDTLEVKTWNTTAGAFEVQSFDLSDQDWKETAIFYLSTLVPDDDLACYMDDVNWTPAECDIRQYAWDKAYPYVNDVWKQMAATIIELLLHYFDPWEPPSLDIIPDLVDEANRTGITLFQRVQPMPQEPTVLQGVAKLFRDFLRKLAMAIGIEDVPPAVEAALMGQGAAVYVGTIRLMLNQTYNGTWESYVKDTYGSLDTAIFMVNLTKQVDQIIFNLYEILTGTEADFEFYYDEYDKLALDLEVLRDGLVEWGLGYDLTLDLGTFLAGTVHGRVTDQHTEKGIAGVAVTALSENRDNAPSTATDEDGYYTLRLPRGEWDIVLEKGGYKAVRSDTYVTPFSESQNNVVMESEELYTESGLASAAQWAVALFIVLIAVLGVSHLYRRKHAPPTKAKSQEGCK